MQAQKIHKNLTWLDVKETFDALSSTNLDTHTVEAWLTLWSDLEKRIRSEETRVRRASFADTTNKEAATDYQHYANQFIPTVESSRSLLREKYLAAVNSGKIEATPKVYQLLQVEAQLDCEANRPLIGEHTLLSNKFGGMMAGLKVTLDNEDLSMREARLRLQSQDRAVREKASRGLWKSRLDNAQAFDDLFLSLVRLRQTMARNAGFNHYRDYLWREYHRFDYTPEDCLVFAEEVATEVLPLLSEVRKKRCELLGVATLRPWDLEVNPFTMQRKPFGTVAELLEKAKKVLEKIDISAAELLAVMERKENLDLESRNNKVFTVYADNYADTGDPMLFMNVTGTASDVRDLFHEFGHAWHYTLAAKQPLYWQRWLNREFMEVASQSLELLSLPFLDAFYDPQTSRRNRFLMLEAILQHLAATPTFDQIQHFVYTQPVESLTIQGIDEKCYELFSTYGVEQDFSGLEHIRRKLWHFNHLFFQPFYYIEYGFAWIGAIDLFAKFQREGRPALHDFKTALSIGNTESLPELYKRVGSSFPIRRGDMKRVTEFLRREFEDTLTQPTL